MIRIRKSTRIKKINVDLTKFSNVLSLSQLVILSMTLIRINIFINYLLYILIFIP